MNSKTKKRPQRPDDAVGWPHLRRVQWGSLILLVTIAEIVYLAGQSTVSYAIDAAAVATFFWIKKNREERLPPETGG